MDIWTNKSMEGRPPVDQAHAAIFKTLERVRDEYNIGYHLGLGTETFAVLTEAAATLSNGDVQTLRREYAPGGDGKKCDTEVLREVLEAWRDYELHARDNHPPRMVILIAKLARIFREAKR